MEIVILHNSRIKFTTKGRENEDRLTRASGWLKADIRPTIEKGSDNGVYCDYLSTAIVERPWTTKRKFDRGVNWDMEIVIDLPNYDESFAGDPPAGELKVLSKTLAENSFLEVLHEMFIKILEKEDDTDNILMNINVENFRMFPDAEDFGSLSLEATGLKLCKNEELDGFSFTYNELVLPTKMLLAWDKDIEFRGSFTISLVLSNAAVSLLCNISITPEMRFKHLKKSLDDETCTDTELLVGFQPNQTAVKCHRLMLVSGSEVFKSMFESGMKETKENRIIIPEMSEKGVRAMLAYLYYRGMKDVYTSGEVAVEVLQAAEKYGIKDLKYEIHDIILARQIGWFTVDVALELLLFVEKLCSKMDMEIGNGDFEEQNKEVIDDIENPDDNCRGLWENLKGKSIFVLKWFAKWEPTKVMKSEKYQEIFNENPKLGMELGLCFLQT